MSDFGTAWEPLGVGSVLSDTFGLYVRHVRLFFGIALVPMAIMSSFNVFALRNVDPASPFGIYTPLFSVGQLVGVVLYLFLIGTIALAAYDAKEGRDHRIHEYARRAVRALPALLVLGLLFYVMAVLAALLFVVPGLYIAARYGQFATVAVVEGTGFRSLGRSSTLTQGYRWPIVLALVLIVLITFAISLGVSFVLGFFGSGFLSFDAPIWLRVPLESVSSAVTTSLSAVFGAVLYLRLREIKEGASVSDVAEVFE
ncbi:MAG: hypothetical protein AAGA32_01370 [Pseudomonadota bacterium]